MQLNLFLPVPKRPRGVLAGARRVLSLLGPSWAQSPLRRGLQVISLVLFLVAFFYVLWPHAGPEYAQARAAREFIPTDTFLRLDPLVGLSAAVSARTWVWAMVWAGALLGVCLIVPSGFCSHACPLGTLTDIFDWGRGGRVRARAHARRGWWVHLRYYLLAAVLIAAVLGVTLSGFVAAIPLLSRGMLFLLAPVQQGALRGWDSLPPISADQYIGIALLVAVLATGFLGRRFWCRCVCPTGAIFSLANLVRLTSRKVKPSCSECGECVEGCAFDAVRPDFTTRHLNCTFCQSCGGVCPARAIDFGPRWGKGQARQPDQSDPSQVRVSRRGFLAAAAGGLVCGVAARTVLGSNFRSSSQPLVRPPGSLPEDEFLRLCIRCGQCMKACPSNVLQPAGFGQGVEGLWMPYAAADLAGCQPECNNCGQVCPTGAIRALPLAEKQAARMGLAAVNERTCLPYAGRQACDVCVGACPHGAVISEAHGKPTVLADLCAGCGACQAACYKTNVRKRSMLDSAAIVVLAGEGREDRITTGSYLPLRNEQLP